MNFISLIWSVFLHICWNEHLIMLSVILLSKVIHFLYNISPKYKQPVIWYSTKELQLIFSWRRNRLSWVYSEIEGWFPVLSLTRILLTLQFLPIYIIFTFQLTLETKSKIQLHCKMSTISGKSDFQCVWICVWMCLCVPGHVSVHCCDR